MAFNYATQIDGAVLMVGGDAGSATSQQIDTAWTFGGASAEAWFLRFISPKSQTNGAFTLHAFCTAATGSPTFNAEIRNGSTTNTNLPDGTSTLGTPGSDQTPAANTWSTFTWTGVTLVAGQTYYVIVYNTHGTPASNHAAWQFRGAFDSGAGIYAHNTANRLGFTTGHTAVGFNSDPTLASGTGLAVVKFADGTIWGFAWAATSNHPSDANDRGNRVVFSEDVTLYGVYMLAGAQVALASLEITTASGGTHQGASPYTFDAIQEQAGGTFFTPITLTGGVEYDIAFTVGSATTHGQRTYMGEAAAGLPADVLDCRPSWHLGFVGGGTTPGSLTLTEELGLPMLFYLDNNPPIAGGSDGVLSAPRLNGVLET